MPSEVKFTINIGGKTVAVADPDSLSDTEWAMLVKELERVRKEEAKRCTPW